MHIDVLIVVGSALVGLLVGMTGAGGGALMTPMLIFVFGVAPSAAISSDLVAAVLMRPVGAAVHLRRGTVNLRMVWWLSAGSVPGAFLGAYLLHLMGSGTAAQTEIEVALGAALLLGAGAMIVRAVTRGRVRDRLPSQIPVDPLPSRIPVKPLPTLFVGLLGGVMVGTTSVGAGSLMIVLLLFLYPVLGSSQLVGTDLVQAIPLTAAAALGQLLFGHVDLAVSASVAIGSVPAVYAGSLLSSRAPDHLVRPVITTVIVISGLKYVGVGTAWLGVAAAVTGACCVGWVLAGWHRSAKEVASLPSVPAPGAPPSRRPPSRRPPSRSISPPDPPACGTPCPSVASG